MTAGKNGDCRRVEQAQVGKAVGEPLPGQRHVLAEQRGHGGQPAGGAGHGCRAQRVGLGERRRGRPLDLVEVRAAQQEGAAQDPRVHHLGRVTGLLSGRDASVGEAGQPVAQTPAGVEDRQPEQRAGPLPGWSDGQLEDAFKPTRTLDEVTPRQPVPPQADPEQQCLFRVVAQCPAECAAEVVMIDVEQLGALDDDTGCPVRVMGKSEIEEMPAVCGLQRLDLPRGNQSLAGQLPDRLKESVPGAKTCPLDLDERLVDDPAETVQHLRAGQPLVRAHLLNRLQREAAGKDREPAEHGLLVLRQQRVAPFERGPQRRVPGDLTASTKQGERLAQPLGDLRRLEVGHASGGELQGERNAVEATADLHHRRRVADVKHEAGPHVVGTVEEQPYGGQIRQAVRVAGVARLG